ncbi:glycosyltransferase [Acinetobacter sp. Marseille-Q1618]|uniref:glycosyltransferase n=1 Tax=Acinetobacter sp. Marseille-Q1618 TaxID=2697502 RepID=UPI0015700821|nr:glycosyltransferase [Acinetobacter sp. Marseille-Q1618]
MPTICLNMIVKNESHIIAKTLENICQHIALDYWVISDTGSTDNTIEIIEHFFKQKNIQGEIQHQAWVNFGHNRDAALQACVGKSDYILFFDADDHFIGNFKLPALQKDSYFFKMTNEGGSTKYLRKLIIKNNGQFFWKGVLHEFLSSKADYSTGTVEGDYAVVSGRKGNRSLDPNKYLKDAQLLEQAIIDQVDPDLEARYSFYCAQSYQDAGQTETAIEWYQKRTELGDWKEEVYVSFMRLGSLFEAKKQTMQALYYWQCGVSVVPERAECWYHLARRNNWDKNYDLALCYAERAQKLALPTGNKLFLNQDIYKFWCHYELCINAFQLGYKEQAYTAFKALVQNASQGLVQRVIHQLDHYQDLIKKDHYLEVKNLIQNLQKLEFMEQADTILNIQKS